MSGEMDTARQHADLVRQRAFRDAMGLFPTGVTLVTARGPDGEDQAITANSVTSVSLDPMLLLVCVEHASRLHDLVLSVGRFAVSVLGLDGEPISRKLARRGHDTDGALAGVPHHRGPHTGALLLDDALATFECAHHGRAPRRRPHRAHRRGAGGGDAAAGGGSAGLAPRPLHRARGPARRRARRRH